MQITIDIPQEFISHFEYDKFADSLNRLKHDANLLAGEYEKELMDMLVGAFKNSRVETGKEEAKSALLTPPHPSWKPKMEQRYYYVMATGESTHAGWTENALDYGRYDIGNIFKSKDEAGFTVERLKVLAEMREWAGSWNSGYVLYLSTASQKLTVRASLCYHGEIRFATKEDADNCIKAVGEYKIKRYYYMIPEEDLIDDKN